MCLGKGEEINELLREEKLQLNPEKVESVRKKWYKTGQRLSQIGFQYRLSVCLSVCLFLSQNQTHLVPLLYLLFSL